MHCELQGLGLSLLPSRFQIWLEFARSPVGFVYLASAALPSWHSSKLMSPSMGETESPMKLNDPSSQISIDSKGDVGLGVIQGALWTRQLQVQLELIQAKVQFPPAGPIFKKDLLWSLRETRRVRQGQGNDTKKVVVVQQCFIPTSRVHDFITGMENTKDGISCKFVKIRTKPAKGEKNFLATETAAHDITR